MLKILYAAGNNLNAKIQLSRFLTAIKGKPYIVKVAAYKKSSPNINVDWTLDCLLNMFKPEQLSFTNDNFQIYFDQVKYFAPDLVISDLEYFTSYIAQELDITTWQCSSSLLNFAVENQEKYNLGLFKRYSFLMGKNNSLRTQQQINIIDNSNCNFVYSHLADIEQPPKLKSSFEWIRPYHTVGKDSVPCQHNIVAGTLQNNKRVFSLLKNYPDSVAFTEFQYENYPNLFLKNIENQEEYFCNLRNCNLFLCEGQTSFLADAYYNNKYSAVLLNTEDLECVMNSLFSERAGLASTIYQIDEDLSKFMHRSVDSRHNDVQFLHERIEEL